MQELSSGTDLWGNSVFPPQGPESKISYGDITLRPKKSLPRGVELYKEQELKKSAAINQFVFCSLCFESTHHLRFREGSRQGSRQQMKDGCMQKWHVKTAVGRLTPLCRIFRSQRKAENNMWRNLLALWKVIPVAKCSRYLGWKHG